MASIHLHSDRLEIRLTAAEKALSLRRDNVEIPRSSIRSATLTDDPWIWVRGVRGKGSAIPLTLAVGQWKSHGGADFLVIKKGSRPAVVLDVEDSEFSRVIVSTNHGAELVAALRIDEEDVRAKKVRATRVRTVSPRPIAVRAKAEAAKIEAAKVKADAKAEAASKSGGRAGVAKKKAAADAAAASSTEKTAKPAAAKKASTRAAAKKDEGSTSTTATPSKAASTKATSSKAAGGKTTRSKAAADAADPAKTDGTSEQKKPTRSRAPRTVAPEPTPVDGEAEETRTDDAESQDQETPPAT
ncbi:hypothetical protein CLV49_1706 [Labedella gwakjiensis]|uniref:Uncharacterized protein n=1 Tax=Labedella gwakjiensis TaxID=390269 RepID=A0A2P8GVW3_9MICO|nr:hypothetical protein [Labedella gwakjiensis]PSL38094.1 hypothetical protein CLV49_1706 [Labedella gwakjiensis]